jgi:hypothetical protein
VVTISHATGAGGETIGRTVAGRLGFHEEIITLAAEKEGVDAALVADAERRKSFLARLFSGLAQGPVDVGVAPPSSCWPGERATGTTSPRSPPRRSRLRSAARTR